MNKAEFLTELEDLLQREEPCGENDVLDCYEEWDSLSKMTILAFYNKNFGIKIPLNELGNLKTVSDLIKLAGDKIQE